MHPVFQQLSLPVEQRDAWDADTEYEGLQWWLGRSNGGAWELVTCGYG